MFLAKALVLKKDKRREGAFIHGAQTNQAAMVIMR
jgi:hypothetical protein